MNKDELRILAAKQAKDFLDNDKEYRMGYLEAEQPHHLTKKLSYIYANDVKEGVKTILSVDKEMAERAQRVLLGEDFKRFADKIKKTVLNGGKVIFSGCGSSGRLSMQLERSWRNALIKLSEKYPHIKNALDKYSESIGYIMTGGDYAVIRAVESFEDSAPLGAKQAEEWHLSEKDLMIGVTATGETTSILATCVRAMEDGADVYMLICADHKPLLSKMERARLLYTNPKCSVMFLPCGAMALTGSSRMQSSTFEQFCASVALDLTLNELLSSEGIKEPLIAYEEYGKFFVDAVDALMNEQSLSEIAYATVKEQELYEKAGLITLYADDYLLDVLTDTTERAPTFMTPPFCSKDMTDSEQSWAFVKNPNLSTDKAWEKCFLRRPRCIEWDKNIYRELNFAEKQIEKIPDIGCNALLKFEIGKEVMKKRQKPLLSHCLWVDVSDAPESFYKECKKYTTYDELTLDKLGADVKKTNMDIFEHISIKLMLNTLSTGVMARMGRISGNWMTCLAMSNKKLVDRSARIVSDVCDVDYETAIYELYYSKELINKQGLNLSPCQETIKRLSAKISQ